MLQLAANLRRCLQPWSGPLAEATSQRRMAGQGRPMDGEAKVRHLNGDERSETAGGGLVR